MPHALVPLPDVYESVIRRVAIAMTRQLGEAMRLPVDTPIRLPGDTGTIPMNNGTFGPCDNTGIIFPGTSGRLTVRFTEETDEQDTLTTIVNRAEHNPIFHDSGRDILLTPVYRRVRMVMSFDYKVENKTQAQRWVDEMRNRISALRAELYHDVEYHYAVPEPIMALLSHLHALKEDSTVPVGETFEEYLDRYSLQPTTTATTLIGTEGRRVVKEHQHEVLGWFDFTDSPDQPEKEGNEAGTYLASFSYTLHYARPTQLWCRWPMLIHNRTIDRVFRPTEAYSTFKRLPRKVSLTKGNFEKFLDDFTFQGLPYIHHPEIDDWSPKDIPQGRLTFFTGLLVINPDNPRRLLNLADMGPFAFTPYFLEYAFQQGERFFTPGKSIFEFRLYENNRLANDIQLGFESGTVTIEAQRDLDLTKYYHIQISLIRDWSFIDQETIQCLRRYPTVAYTALLALGVYLGGGSLEDLKRLGVGSTRLTTEQCPGEGSLIGPPEHGGTWPWPWLGEEWDMTPWPGCGWEGPGWPGNLQPELVPTLPAWYTRCGGNPNEEGIIRDRDIKDAVDETMRNSRQPERINPRVLYLSILTYKP
jgi:hypothetical protein